MPRPDGPGAVGAAALVWLALAGLTSGAAWAAWSVAGTGPTTGRAAPLPAAPSPVTVARGSCTLTQVSLTLSWPAVSGATGYEVQRTAAGITTTSSTTATSVTDTALLASLTTYTVRAQTSGWWGPRSASVSSPSSC